MARNRERVTERRGSERERGLSGRGGALAANLTRNIIRIFRAGRRRSGGGCPEGIGYRGCFSLEVGWSGGLRRDGCGGGG